jgi:dynein heavy chain
MYMYIYVLSGKKPDWDTSKQLLSDSKFIRQLQCFERDNIDPKRLKALQKYIEMQDFNYTKIASVSKAASGLCNWVQGMLFF